MILRYLVEMVDTLASECDRLEVKIRTKKGIDCEEEKKNYAARTAQLFTVKRIIVEAFEPSFRVKIKDEKSLYMLEKQIAEVQNEQL